MAELNEELQISSSELAVLDPQRMKLTRGPGDSIRLIIEDWDRSYLRVRIRRAFPLSEPDRYIGFHDGDDKDIGVLESVHDLDSESQQIIQEELNKRYFIPVIRKIISLQEEYGMSYWLVETDRGEKEFVVRGRRESLHELPGTNRVLVLDVDGNRYDIPDSEALDKRSFALLSKILY